MSRKSSYKIDFTIVSKHEALSFYFLYQMKKHVYVFDILRRTSFIWSIVSNFS